jgi:hypothetical protein
VRLRFGNAHALAKAQDLDAIRHGENVLEIVTD